MGEHLRKDRASGGARDQSVVSLKDVWVPKDRMPSPQDKPTYHTVVACVSKIDPERQLYYLANPDSGRKVRVTFCLLTLSFYA